MYGKTYKPCESKDNHKLNYQPPYRHLNISELSFTGKRVASPCGVGLFLIISTFNLSGAIMKQFERVLSHLPAC